MNDGNPDHAGPRAWIGLAVLAAAASLIAMDTTALLLALPTITGDLDAGASQMLWIQDVYGFLVAGLLITMGVLGDRIGRRRLLLVGATVFGAASVLAALAANATVLIVARALLGIAGAAIVPPVLGLIRGLFPDPRQRTIAISTIMAAFTASGALGPVIGGALVEAFGWPSIFWISIPVVAVILGAVPLLLAEQRDPAPGRLDPIGLALSMVAVLPLVGGIKEAARGGPSLLAVLGVAVGVGFGALLVRRQRRLERPLLDLALLRDRTVGGPLASMVLAQFALAGTIFLLAQYFQLVAARSPVEAGLLMMPGTVAFAVMALVVPRLVTRIPRERMMSVGLAGAAVGFGLIATVGVDTPIVLPVAAAVLGYAGVAPALLLTTDLVVSSAPPERAGSAAALSSTGIEFGLALGVATLGSMLTAVYRGALDTLPAGLPPEATATARESLAGARTATEGLPDSVAAPVLDAARDAFVDGVTAVGITSVLVTLLALVAVALSTRGRVGQTARS